MELKLNYDKLNLTLIAAEDGVYFKPRDYENEDDIGSLKYASLCEVKIRGRMTHAHTGLKRMMCSERGLFAYKSHREERNESGAKLTVVQESDIARLTSFLTVYAGTNTLRIYHTLENISDKPFTVEYIGTYGNVALIDKQAFGETELWIPTNGSYCECQWNRGTLKSFGIFGGHNNHSTKKILISNVGTWSTKSYLPMGVIREKNGHTTMWQIEANGSWSYELSDLKDSLTLHLNGPTFDEHNWQQTLKPCESFTTVAAAITEGADFNEVVKNMTAYRRSIVGASHDRAKQPIIFNEYMYASWNTPSAETARTLAPIAADCGADYFVIDCGWHDEEPDPFYYVGRWEESRTRYPDGLKQTLDFIRSRGLKVGLWMEPEVVGAKGDARKLYDDDCFFSHGKEVLGISDRYQLDFRNKKVTGRLDKIIDKLVNEYGIDYLKIDYNIEAGVGTDYGAESYGNGLLAHNRAYIDWLKAIKKRHPKLVVENCASGGNRMDYLTMSICDMQSTSDQINYKIYPYIAANMFSALLPEQAAVWAYPAAGIEKEQPSKECVIMNMINGMAGRMHLASKLNLLSSENLSLVKEATRFYKKLSDFRKNAEPYFVSGLPTEMDASWIVYGLRKENTYLMFVYRMDGAETVEAKFDGEIESAEVVYPASSDIKPKIKGNTMSMRFPSEYSARVVRLSVKNN